MREHVVCVDHLIESERVSAERLCVNLAVRHRSKSMAMVVPLTSPVVTVMLLIQSLPGAG